MRPSEVDYLKGVSNKSMLHLGWYPKINFTTLVKRMVDNDTREGL